MMMDGETMWYYKWRGSALTHDHKNHCEDGKLKFRVEFFEAMMYDDVDVDDDDSDSDDDDDDDTE